MTFLNIYLCNLMLLLNVCAIQDEEWIKFKRDFNKSYEDLEQEVHRFNIFKSNLKQILQHNEHYEEGLVTYTKRINKHGDLTEAEFLDFYGLLTSKTVVYNDTVNVTTSVNDGAPNFLDWREKGAVTSVKDQGHCGSCWIFGAIGVLEGYYFRKHSKLISFSAQNMVDCISNYTCLGGLPEGVFFYVQKHRISADDDYPYEAKRGECKKNQHERINISFDNVMKIYDNETFLKLKLFSEGPIVVSLYATSSWMFYDSGVWYEKECAEVANHSVLLVGYGEENGRKYWLIKNSMGEHWGEGGYMKFARNKHHNYCGIMSGALYVN